MWTLILTLARHMAANTKLAVYANFTSPVAIRKKCHSEGHATAACQDARGPWCLPLRFGTNPLSVQHKHFCRVNMFTELWSLMKYASSDSPLLVNMFSHLRHCKHRARKTRPFFRLSWKFETTPTHRRPILGRQRGHNIISTDVRLCRHHS